MHELTKDLRFKHGGETCFLPPWDQSDLVTPLIVDTILPGTWASLNPKHLRFLLSICGLM